MWHVNAEFVGASNREKKRPSAGKKNLRYSTILLRGTTCGKRGRMELSLWRERCRVEVTVFEYES